MLKLYETIGDFEILQTLSAKLTWSHLLKLIAINDILKREFYITMCTNERWSVRTLNERINSMLYERTAISKKPEETIINDLNQLSENNKMSINLFFRDPYVLDFLDLKDTYSEKDLEEIELLELGSSGIHVEYMTQLPPKEVLQGKLHAAIENAREKFEDKQIE
ncbi:protein of unknown function DUF1016 [Clostridium carboxidivorans P7]|uniref:YhcG N-terminal domain-containing protein n=1 Tax=Clostridium carboxidivorans P7 TaxID=536227 RepID=C6PSY3_9CLOT|nr:DUF1016 N-terminal domain-containing protein [Clostridium carboxidivorans]EET87618.1 protein of unknown function DUF1016 [Clostridium carboxidivorans P7]